MYTFYHVWSTIPNLYLRMGRTSQLQFEKKCPLIDNQILGYPILRQTPYCVGNCSCNHFLGDIARPTVILQSLRVWCWVVGLHYLHLFMILKTFAFTLLRLESRNTSKNGNRAMDYNSYSGGRKFHSKTSRKFMTNPTSQQESTNNQSTNDSINNFLISCDFILVMPIMSAIIGFQPLKAHVAQNIEDCGDVGGAKRLVAFLAPLLPSSRTIFHFHFVLSAVIWSKRLCWSKKIKPSALHSRPFSDGEVPLLFFHIPFVY